MLDSLSKSSGGKRAMSSPFEEAAKSATAVRRLIDRATPANGCAGDFEGESDRHVTAFVSLHLIASAWRRGAEIETRIRSLRQVVECHAVSGEFDYLLKVVVPSLGGLADFLNTGLMQVPGIARLRATICVAEIKTPPGPRPPRATRLRRLHGDESLAEAAR